jgi:hypothetical protein
MSTNVNLSQQIIKVAAPLTARRSFVALHGVPHSPCLHMLSKFTPCPRTGDAAPPEAPRDRVACCMYVACCTFRVAYRRVWAMLRPEATRPNG